MIKKLQKKLNSAGHRLMESSLIRVFIILLPFVACSLICYLIQNNNTTWIEILTCGLGTSLSIYISFWVNRQSLDLEFKKDKVSKIQQELANRFEKFSPYELVLPSLFADIPSHEMAIEYKNKLNKQLSKCNELLVSANLLYSDDNKHPQSKVFLEAYKDMMEYSSQLIWALLLTLNEENKQNWKNYSIMYTFLIGKLFKKYNNTINKANNYIGVLNTDFEAHYSKLDNPFNHNNNNLDIIYSQTVQKEEEEEEEEEEVINN